MCSVRKDAISSVCEIHERRSPGRATRVEFVDRPGCGRQSLTALVDFCPPISGEDEHETARVHQFVCFRFGYARARRVRTPPPTQGGRPGAPRWKSLAGGEIAGHGRRQRFGGYAPLGWKNGAEWSVGWVSGVCPGSEGKLPSAVGGGNGLVVGGKAIGGDRPSRRID